MFTSSGHRLHRGTVHLIAGTLVVLVAALVLATMPYANAATERIALDIGSGTFYRTVATGSGIRLAQPVDAFATNPFTSSPARWDDGATLNVCYINSDRIRIGDGLTTDACKVVVGATLCFDTDNAVGCSTTQATTDSVNPPQLAFETDITMSENLASPASRLWYGFLNCPNYNDGCTAGADTDVSYTTTMLRNFVGMRTNKASGQAYYQFRSEIKYDDGTGSNGSYTSPVCTLNDLCRVSGTYTGGGLTITVTAASGNVSTSTAIGVAGQTLNLNSIGMALDAVSADDPEYDFDNSAMTMRVSGNWQSVAVDARSLMSAFEIEHVVASARDLSNLAFLDGGISEATYTPDITTGTFTTIDSPQLTTGTFTSLSGSVQVNVTLDGDRIWTSEVDSATFVLTVGDSGGGGDPAEPPVVPPPLDAVFRKARELCNIWLLVFLVLVVFIMAGIRRAKVRGPAVRP